MEPIKIKGMDEHTKEALQNVAVVMNTNAQEMMKRAGEAMLAVNEVVTTIVEQIGGVDFSDLDLPRSPEEIKKDIKHVKNPMRLKQLNRELNESYKAYKKVRNKK